MATVPELSKSFTLSYASKVIAKCTDFSLEINKEVIDITSLSSGAWKEKLVDLKEWKISFNGLVTRGTDGTYTVYDALISDILTNDTAVTVVISTVAAGGSLTLTGSAFLTSLQTSIQVGDKGGYAGTLEGTGSLVKS